MTRALRASEDRARAARTASAECAAATRWVLRRACSSWQLLRAQRESPGEIANERGSVAAEIARITVATHDDGLELNQRSELGRRGGRRSGPGELIPRGRLRRVQVERRDEIAVCSRKSERATVESIDDEHQRDLPIIE